MLSQGAFDGFRGNVLVFDMGDGTVDGAIMRVEQRRKRAGKDDGGGGGTADKNKKRRKGADGGGGGGGEASTSTAAGAAATTTTPRDDVDDDSDARRGIVCHMTMTAFSSVCGGKSFTMEMRRMMQRDVEAFVAR